eukprot:816167_1
MLLLLNQTHNKYINQNHNKYMLLVNQNHNKYMLLLNQNHNKLQPKKQEITKKEKPQIQKETKALNNEEIEALKMESPEIENILDDIQADEKLNIAEEKLTYTYSNEGEYKEIGMVWDTYKPR